MVEHAAGDPRGASGVETAERLARLQVAQEREGPVERADVGVGCDDDAPRAGTPSQTVPGTNGDMIEAELTRREEVEAMREAILELKEQERIVLSLYYFEELKLHEIGAIIQLTESRVSQIRSRAVAKLRQRMAALREMAA